MSRRFPFAYHDTLNKRLVLHLDTDRDAYTLEPVGTSPKSPIYFYENAPAVGGDTSYTSEPLILMKKYTPLHLDKPYITDWVVLTTNGDQLIVNSTTSRNSIYGPYNYGAFFKLISSDPQGRIIIHNRPPFNPRILAEIRNKFFMGDQGRGEPLPPFIFAPGLGEMFNLLYGERIQD